MPATPKFSQTSLAHSVLLAKNSLNIHVNVDVIAAHSNLDIQLRIKEITPIEVFNHPQ